MRLTRPIAAWAARDPDRLCVVDGELRLSRGAVLAGIARCAALIAQGVDVSAPRLAVVAPGSWPMLRSFFGALWAGGIAVAMNGRWTVQEMADAMRIVVPHALAFDPASGYDPDALLTTAPGARIRIWLGRCPPPPGWTAIGEADALPLRPERKGRGDEIASLFFTSGTSGRLKAAALTHRNLLYNAFNARRAFALDEECVQVHCQPLFHLAGGARLFNTFLVGGRHVMMDRFDVDALIRTIATERVTHVGLVPTMLRMLLDSPAVVAADLSSLRMIGYGAAPMPPALLELALARLPHVGFVQSYGMTELSPVVTSLGPDDHRLDAQGEIRLRSVGRTVRHVELSIRAANGVPVPQGDIGEIWVRGPTVMAGYWNDPDETARTILDGWLKTGDAGWLDADGYLYLADRLKDIIITGGENVASIEVEAVICDHPSVRECAVVGAPHTHWGEQVHAEVVTIRPVGTDELDRHCRARLAGYKCPRSWHVGTDPLPRNSVGKVQKHLIRARLRDRETT